MQLQIELLPSATLFRTGDELRLDIAQRWFHGRDPAHGQFPVGYDTVANRRCTLHLGSHHGGCTLTIPVLIDAP